MQKINYQDLSRVKEHREKVRKEIKKEYEGGEPNSHRLNRLMEAEITPDIFGNAYSAYTRFRTPW